MTKENLEPETKQFNRVDKIEVNCGSVNLWLVLGVAVLVVYLLGKVELRSNGDSFNNERHRLEKKLYAR